MMRILISGAQGEGKSAVAAVILVALTRAGCTVDLVEETPCPNGIAKTVLNNLRPSITIKTTNRGQR